MNGVLGCFHMLRTMLRDSEAASRGRGDKPNPEEPFFRTLRKVRERYASKSIGTRELIAAFSKRSCRVLFGTAIVANWTGLLTAGSTEPRFPNSKLATFGSGTMRAKQSSQVSLFKRTRLKVWSLLFPFSGKMLRTDWFF